MSEAAILQLSATQQQMPVEKMSGVINELGARTTEVRAVREQLVPGGGGDGHTSTALNHLAAAQEQLQQVMGMVESARQELASAEYAVRTAG